MDLCSTISFWPQTVGQCRLGASHDSDRLSDVLTHMLHPRPFPACGTLQVA